MACISDLPAELLIRIFAKLSQKELSKIVPRVSQTWRQVATLPQLWSSMVLDLDRAFFFNGDSLAQFLSARAAGIESLALQLPGSDYWKLGANRLRGLLECLRGLPNLRRLCFGVKHSAPDEEKEQIATALSLLDSTLEVLCLHGLMGRRWEQSLARMSSFAASLRVLHLHYDGDEAENMTSAFPDEVLGLATCLEELMISGKGGSLNEDALPPSVGRLTRLTSLSFIHAGGGRVPEQWQALTGLQVLRVIAVMDMELHLPDLSMLSRLAVVDLCCCNVPTGLAALPSLTHLTLRGLWTDRHGPQAWLAFDAAEQDPDEAEAFDTLLGDSWPVLECLCLRNCNLRELPDGVAQRTSLRSLAITNTHMWRLPTDPQRMRFLANLRHLDLTANCFSHVPLQAVAAQQLQTLALLDGEPAWDIAAARLGSAVEYAAELAELQARLQAQWTTAEGKYDVQVHHGCTAKQTCTNCCYKDVSTAKLLHEWVAAQAGVASGADTSPERPEPFVAHRFLPQAKCVRYVPFRPFMFRMRRL